MQVHPTTSVSSEIHYHVREQSLKHKLSSTTEKIIQLNPRLLLGESNLFNYDPTNHALVLAPQFQSLLTLLIQLDELDCKALTANTLYDLNSILQQVQGNRGGLLRKEGTERWHLEDNPTKQKCSQTFNVLLQQLGFVFPKSLDSEMTVDHCIVFGARTERMETRIIETLVYLQNNLKVTGHIFLLGSNRKLIQAEIEHLKSKLEKLEESQRNYWSEVFNDPEQTTEANAFVFLWKCIVPQQMQTLLEDKIVGIKSTRIGNSYIEQFGHRATTEITIEDWMTFYKAEEPQAIFALAEQPYIRLADQLKFTVLSKGKKANTDELIKRIKNTTFYFAFPNSSFSPLISVMLDEIGRNVYRISDTLKYLESLE
ncbi:hypothetical protein [Candidatus Protochlamydia sp. W-9]|uniref:hypothetical protein n=1 Tax=Candidatus Protochlamydia sp. W-9 TaxID=1785087 RepID=UPI00096A59F8|nr:hypothetical protein [Candidatus Protochlamydia sp. W-9]